MVTAETTVYDPEVAAALRDTPAHRNALRRWISDKLEGAKVRVFDADFIFIFTLAIHTDALDIINLTGVGKILTIVIDIILFFLMLLWRIWRSNMIENAKEEANQALEAYVEGTGGRKRIGATRAIAKSAAKGGIRRSTRVAARRGVLGKAAMGSLRKVGLAAVAEIIPFLGLIPWWTILVLLSLKEKVELEK